MMERILITEWKTHFKSYFFPNLSVESRHFQTKSQGIYICEKRQIHSKAYMKRQKCKKKKNNQGNCEQNEKKAYSIICQNLL